MHKTSGGVIELIMGPMFSGKSTELLRRLNRHEFAGNRVLLVKHQADMRYKGSESRVVTHDQNSRKAQLSTDDLTRDLTDEILSNYDVLGIDEAQFFDKEILTIVESIANSGKIVILAGLDGSFHRK